MLILNQLTGLGASSDLIFNVEAAQFDGSNDYLSRGGALTGVSNGKQLTLSFWIYRTSLPGSTTIFYNATSNEIEMSLNNSGELLVAISNTSSSAALSASISGLSAGVWHHVALSADMSDNGKRHFMLNGVDASPTWSVYNNQNLFFAQNEHVIGANTSGGQKTTMALSEFWLSFGEYVDLSVAANLQKFRSADGYPVNLGSDGSSATGTAPHIYQSVRPGEGISAFVTNRGTGGGMTENGALALASTSPSEG